MNERHGRSDLPRITLAVLSIFVLIAAAGWVLFPFVAATLWATMIVIATWPILLAAQRMLGGRRGPAVAVMVLLLLAVLIVPIWVAISTIGDNYGRLVRVAEQVVRDGLPPPPAWIGSVPLFGEGLHEQWSRVAGNPELLSAKIQPYTGAAAKWIADKAGSLGAAVVQLLLTVLVSGVLFASGETAARGVVRFMRRLTGPRGEEVATLAAKAVRAVALGIVVTAVAQTLLAGAGLFLGGVPQAGVLTAVVFLLCIAQVGPLLVLAPAAIWLFSSGSAGKGAILVAFGLVAVTLDNFLRPLLIKKGADLPLLLIMAGVIGGILGFGVLGIFIGPVILAVTWELLASWVAEQDEAAPAAGKGPG
ncbi:MAG TPA: AI-2E family transporter YdiK [Anaeromyxobacteraceae bacterium]|nr:AI-2E family transporter YdiK [Anaeromyxobacteraceae bacterium]